MIFLRFFGRHVEGREELRLTRFLDPMVFLYKLGSLPAPEYLKIININIGNAFKYVRHIIIIRHNNISSHEM